MIINCHFIRKYWRTINRFRGVPGRPAQWKRATPIPKGNWITVQGTMIRDGWHLHGIPHQPPVQGIQARIFIRGMLCPAGGRGGLNTLTIGAVKGMVTDK